MTSVLIDTSNTPAFQSRHFQLRPTTFNGSSVSNKVSLSVGTDAVTTSGVTKSLADYTLRLPGYKPTAGQILKAKDDVSGNLEWAESSSGGFFYQGTQQYNDEHGNVLSVLKEVSLEPGDPGYDVNAPNHGGIKVKFTNTDCLVNMDCYRTARDATKGYTSTTALTTKPDGEPFVSGDTQFTTPFVPTVGIPYEFVDDLATTAGGGSGPGYISVGKPIKNATGFYSGDLSQAHMTGQPLQYPPTVTANKQGYQDFDTTPGNVSGTNDANAPVTSVDAAKQFQDTFNILTRRELDNTNSLTPNDFTLSTYNPIGTLLSGTRGAGSSGSAYTGVYELKASLGASSGNESLTFKTGTAGSLSNILLSATKDSVLLDAVSSNASLTLASGGLTVEEAGNNVITASSTEVKLNPVTSAASLSVNGSGLTFVDNSSSNVLVASDTSVLLNAVTSGRSLTLDSTNLRYSDNSNNVLVATTASVLLDAVGVNASLTLASGGLTVEESGNNVVTASSTEVKLNPVTSAASLSINGSGLTFVDNSSSNVIVASDTSVLLDAATSNSSLTLNSSGLAYEFNGVNRLVTTTNDTVVQATATSSKLEVLGSSGSEQLKYTLDATTGLSSSTAEPILKVSKSSFKMGSANGAAADFGTSLKTMYVESDTSSDLVYRVVFHDDADTGVLKDRKVEFNRNPFSSGQLADNNVYDVGMKMRVELPQIELVSADKTKFFRILGGNDGNMYIQMCSATAGSDPAGPWLGCSVVVDSVVDNSAF